MSLYSEKLVFREIKHNCFIIIEFSEYTIPGGSFYKEGEENWYVEKTTKTMKRPEGKWIDIDKYLYLSCFNSFYITGGTKGHLVFGYKCSGMPNSFMPFTYSL